MYNLEWLLSKKEGVGYLFFWGHQKSEKITVSCFSQWWEASFVVEGVEYLTAEHWMMAQKALLFKDEESFQKIIESKTAKEAKSLGRTVKNFDDETWKSKCFEIVVQGNFHKFSQHEELKYFLLNTNNQVIVEASPVDKIWGIGLKKENPKCLNPRTWNGENLLGFALMDVRDLLKK